MKNLAMAYAMKKRQKMARGGQADSVPSEDLQKSNLRQSEKHAKNWKHNSPHKSLAGTSQGQGTALKDFDDTESAKKDAEAALHYQRSMKKGYPDHFAEGGMVDEEAEYDPIEHPMPVDNEAADHEADMVSRIMKRMYSKGGMVANDVGIAEADKEPAEYDDLVLRDDLDSSYTGENSGDEIGNEGEDERRSDIVSRIMRSRKKGGRMPRPA